MSRIVLALDFATEDRLLGDIVGAGHEILSRVTSASEIVRAVESGSPDFAIVSASASCLTSDVLASCDGRGVRLIALAVSEAERRNATSIGLYEVLDAAVPWTDIEHLMHGDVLGGHEPVAADISAPGPNPQQRGRGVIAVWGPTGAPGRTTTAITIAAEIAAHGHSVVLADIDAYGGAIAPALGLLDEAPGFAAACRLAGSDSLTVAELERIGQRYSSATASFWVLTGIGRPSRWPELSNDRVVKAIRACRDWVDYVVIDTGFSLEHDEEISSDLFAPRRNAATLASIRSADHVVAVGAADPIGLARFLRAHVDLLEMVDAQKISVVVNRVRAGVIGLNPNGQVRQTLLRFGGIADPVLVPNDPVAADAALLSGSTLRDVVPKSPALASIEQFVRTGILPPSPLPARRRARRGRVATALG